MSSKSNTGTCCLTLPLRLEPWQADRLAKRFEIARQIYNTFVRAELKKLHRIQATPEYRAIQAKYRELCQHEGKHIAEFRQLKTEKQKLLRAAGFELYTFMSDIVPYYKHFNTNIGSQVAARSIATPVWIAFHKYVLGDGKRIHFKRPGDIRSLQGHSVSGKSGGREIIFHKDHIAWNGLKLPLKLNPRNQYETEMLTKRVKYVRILRKTGKTKDRWYAQLVLEGKPAIKRDPNTGAPVHPVGRGPVGIDIGPQTIAYSSEKEAALLELADQVKNLDREKRLIQRKLDRSRRATNPDNYAPDGTIKRGVRLTRNKSRRYRKLQHQLAFLQSQQAELRVRQHTKLANHLLSLGDCFFVEDMVWPSLTRRAKETEISEKTGKYKRKKRFGKSIANKAPATLIRILTQKCSSLGIPGVVKVPPSVKASQYNHLTNTYEKKSLSQRWNIMPDGRKIQRDLYSAFLLQHVSPQSNQFDVDALHRNYEHFVTLHDNVICELSHAPKTIASMGIVRTHS